MSRRQHQRLAQRALPSLARDGRGGDAMTDTIDEARGLRLDADPALQGHDLWVVVPGYNEAAWIGATIDALAAQEDRDFTVLVVDNASTDGTARCTPAAPARCETCGPSAPPG